MKISSLILTGFFSILLLFSITTFINHQQTDKINENAENFNISSAVLRQSNRFQRNMLSMISGLRGYLLTNELSFIQSYDSALVENNAIITELSGLIQTGTSQDKLLDEIHTLHTTWVKEFAEPLVNAKELAAQSDSSAISFSKLYKNKLSDNVQKRIQQELQRKFRAFANFEYADRERQRAILKASFDQVSSISFYLTLFSLVIGIAIALFLANYISSSMIKLVDMADSIARGNFSIQLKDRGNDELSRLTRSLNSMASVLSENISLLRRRNDELDQFAHIVSHDLKAPLRGIDNVVCWIEEDHSLDLPFKVKEYIALIKGRIIRAENLLNGILSYCRVGREVQAKERVNLNELVNEIRENLPADSNIELQVPQQLPKLLAERLPLFQVFSNLVGNAYKYHHADKGMVKVYFEEFDSHYKFFVQDNGPGIAKPYHDKIFMIFQTLQERDLNESTGVGLAIVKKILADRKLEIEVISESGKGATFAFTWPKY